ncbi:MAG: hypothetical protein EPN34_03120 [Burkholderiaceae bacterium]|nr:MAG: hypothetical protein EPN34_03120 [Burkholderiaceae bacterium]
MSTMQDIQKRAAILASTRDALAGTLRDLQARVDALKRAELPRIQRNARTVAADYSRLADLIRDNRELFAKPRTYIVQGLRFGLTKKRGKMTWGTDQQLIERIKRLAAAGDIAGDQLAILIQTTEKPVAKALEQLDGKLLKKLGVTVEADCDDVLIKSVGGDVEKAVNAVIKDVAADERAELAA